MAAEIGRLRADVHTRASEIADLRSALQVCKARTRPAGQACLPCARHARRRRAFHAGVLGVP